jgi:multidrug efflux pump subunit AcrB
MAKFFIDRPIFAWVIALFVIVAGAVSITQLPVAQYPTVAPPSIVVTATYPGASAKTLENSTLSVIEQEMNGSPGLAYMETVAQANGTGTLTLTFTPNTNPDLAQVDVQNRLSRATPRLPAAVTQQGVRVDKARSNFLMFTILSSDDPKWDPIALGDYAARNVLPELQRVPGVGTAQLFGTERAMRIWIDPAKLRSFNLSSSDVNAASFAAQLLMPIFDAGRTESLVRGATAQRDIALAQYERAIQAAFRDVADALAGRATLVDQLRALEVQRQAEAARLQLVQVRVDNGVGTTLELLDAERSLFAAAQAEVQTRLAEQQSRIAMYRALGGGVQ